MKTTMNWIAGAVLMTAMASIAIGSMAQAPATPAGQAPGGRGPGGAGGRGGGNRGRLALTTDGFDDGGIIPVKYTAAAEGGATVSPKLTIANPPDGVVSYALILHDPDTSVMKGTAQILHWLIFNIPGTTTELPEGVATTPTLPDGSIQLLNYSKKPGYVGMGAGPNGPYHHYTFELYALDTKLTLGADATQDDVMKAMDGHVLGKGVLVGRYHRAQ